MVVIISNLSYLLTTSLVGQNDTDIDVSGGYMLCVCETRKSQNMNTVGMLVSHGSHIPFKFL